MAMGEKLKNIIRHNNLITCILPVGCARTVLEKLKKDKGITRANIYHARGVGASSLHRSVFAATLEKDVLEVVVSRQRAEEIFNYLYMETRIYERHQGIMYMEKVNLATEFHLPSTLEQV